MPRNWIVAGSPRDVSSVPEAGSRSSVAGSAADISPLSSRRARRGAQSRVNGPSASRITAGRRSATSVATAALQAGAA